MIRGATTQFRFKLPCLVSDLKSARITFWQPFNNGPTQDRTLPIIKTLAQCTNFDSYTLSVNLNQEETLRFNNERKAYVQCRVMTNDSKTYSTKEKIITVYPSYDDTIISDVEIPTHTTGEDLILDGGTI